MTNRILDAARRYKEAGYHPIPLHPKSKQPTDPNWPEHVYDWQNIERVFTLDGNIGVVLGSASGGLVDVDLDCPEAIALADYLLPKTEMIFGRKSAPRSHRIYRCSDYKETRIAFSSPEGSILELRANRHQTVFPPSVHESGEEVTFALDGQPTSIAFAELKKSCELLAIGSMLVPYWTKGSRHSLSLAVSGAFASAGWLQRDVETLFNAVTAAANDNEVDDRLVSVATTYEKQLTRQPIAGKSELKRIVGEQTADRICKILGATERPDTIKLDVSTDAGAAMAFAHRYRGELKYVPEDKAWYARNNKVYRPASPDQIQGAAMNFMMEACKSLQGPYYQQIKQLQSRGRINAITELSRSELAVKLEALDSNPYVVGCKDGSVLDLRTRKLTDPGDEIVTKALGTNYDPDAQCPTWLKFLGQIFPDDAETIEFLQRALG